MNLKVALCFLIIAVGSAIIETHQNFENSAWIPLTREDIIKRYARTDLKNIAGQLSRFLPKYTENNDKAIPGPLKSDGVNTLNSKVLNVISPVELLKFHQENAFLPLEPATLKSVNDLQYEACKTPGCVSSQVAAGNDLKHERDNNSVNSQKSETMLRKPKSILNEESLANNYEINEKSPINNMNKLTDNRKLYEVTEESSDIVEEDVRNANSEKGYFYVPPIISQSVFTDNNITNTFLNILSKHNIKPNDDLQNYALSRKVNNQNPTKGFTLIPIPVRIFPQFAHLKPFSVDPLLAVLMSNYGYYFPGSYGIHNRYRNLYGYLASNNIHNNKPFGSYKIFSDTDSSN